MIIISLPIGTASRCVWLTDYIRSLWSTACLFAHNNYFHDIIDQAAPSTSKSTFNQLSSKTAKFSFMATSECVVCMWISSLANDPAAPPPATFSPAANAVVSRVWLTTPLHWSIRGVRWAAEVPPASEWVSVMRGERPQITPTDTPIYLCIPGLVCN